MTYQTTANKIIRESIKSAVFIDENALPFYSSASEPSIYEERLSVELFNNFKDNGISLAIHKFKNGNENETELKKYLFEARDLVLLDWKLDGEYGEESSLRMLADVINSAHIHFCVIYTSEPNLDNVYANIVSYFSGKDKFFYDSLLEKFDAYEDVLAPIFERFNLFNNALNRPLITDIKAIGTEFCSQLNETNTNIIEAFKHLKIAFSTLHKSNKCLSIPELISFENKTIVINNTIVTLIHKNDEDATNDAESLIERFSTQIVNSKNSYTQLLGLEMQSLFSRNGAFIDSNFINVSKKTLAYHRNQLMEETDSDVPFREVMKKVFLEHANLNLNTSELKILSPVIFETESSDEIPDENELASMNVFYNSLKLSTKEKKLDFGDVFKVGENEFYICITALCDCLRPQKTDYIFYFAKGQSIPIEKAMKLGDTAFISFIAKDKAIVWSNLDIVKSESEEGRQKELEHFKYKPIYIKPLSFLVHNPEFIDDSISLARVFQYKQEKGDLEFINLKYVTTIKPNYAQRIANHAFTHPVRIGVDFVKKN